MGKKMNWWKTLSPLTRQIFIFWGFGCLTAIIITAMVTGNWGAIVKILAPYLEFLL